MKKSLSRARVGFLILIGVITFVAGTFFIGEKSRLFTSTFYVQVNFTAAEGVKPGNLVMLSGYNIGTVTDIALSENADSVRLLLRVGEDVHRFIKADSKAEIKQEGLVGNKIINIIPGSQQLKQIEDYDYIQGVPPFALTSLADNVTSITDTSKIIANELKQLLVRLNRGEGSLGRLLTDPEIYDNLRNITAKTDTGLEIATRQITQLADLIGRLTKTVDVLAMKADTTIKNANTISREVEILVRNLNDGKGTVGALLSDRGLYDSLATLVGTLNDMSIDAGSAADQASKSIYNMRRHWLFGRVFGGDDMEKETTPESAYRRRLNELKKRQGELDKREEQIRELERKLGVNPPGEGK
jgi:phospholipid/cholesterol/gamma-HCH transport system substrate-binding protein